MPHFPRRVSTKDLLKVFNGRLNYAFTTRHEHVMQWGKSIAKKPQFAVMIFNQRNGSQCLT